MTRSFRWPLLVAGLGVGLVVGRYAGLPSAHGDATTAHTAIPAEMTSYRNVVKEVLPAVVSIEVKEKATKSDGSTARRRPQLNPQQIPEEFRKFFQSPDMDEMPHQQAHAFGSGFIVDPSGVVLTNNHVVDGADEVVVTMTDNRKFTTSDIKRDPKSDLAIVRIKASGKLPFLRFADSGQAEIGDRVLAVRAAHYRPGRIGHARHR